MALTRADHVSILRHLQSQLREIDPELHSIAIEHVESREEPRSYLLEYLSVLARLMSERSSGSHGRILNMLNMSVRTQDGGPVRGIRLELAPAERELVRREHVDLAALPDRTEIVTQLRVLHDEILEEEYDRGGEL